MTRLDRRDLHRWQTDDEMRRDLYEQLSALFGWAVALWIAIGTVALGIAILLMREGL